MNGVDKMMRRVEREMALDRARQRVGRATWVHWFILAAIFGIILS